jgi:hypothetical protein
MDDGYVSIICGNEAKLTCQLVETRKSTPPPHEFELLTFSLYTTTLRVSDFSVHTCAKYPKNEQKKLAFYPSKD